MELMQDVDWADLGLVMVRGLPGSGKSTYAKKNFKGHIILEPDNFVTDSLGRYMFTPRSFNVAKTSVMVAAEMYLDQGYPVAVVDVFPRLKDIQEYIDICERLGLDMSIYTVHGDFGSIHGVPDSEMSRMERLWFNIRPREFSKSAVDVYTNDIR